MDKKKYKKLDIQCYNCGKKYNFEEELEREAIEIHDNYAILWCDFCSNETFINHKGRKSRKIDY